MPRHHRSARTCSPWAAVTALGAILVAACASTAPSSRSARAPVVAVDAPAGGSVDPVQRTPPAEGGDEASSAAVPELAWERSAARARARAREQGRPLLVYVRADWLAAAADIERQVWTDERVRRAMNTVVGWQLDVSRASSEQEAELAVLRVHRLPAVVLLDADERELGRLAGAFDAPAVLELLARAAQ